MSSLGIMTEVNHFEVPTPRTSDAVPKLPSIQGGGAVPVAPHALGGPLIHTSAHLNPSFEDLGFKVNPDYSYLKRKGSMPQVVRSPFPSESVHLFPAHFASIPLRFKSIAPLPPLQPRNLNVPRIPTPPNTPVDKAIHIHSPHAMLATTELRSQADTPDMRDPVGLLLFLSEVNLSKFGFGRNDSLEMQFINKVRSEVPQSFYSQDDDDFYSAIKRKKRRAPVDYSLDDLEVPTSSPRKDKGPKSPTTSSPRAPYKGKYGLHPKCGSCGTSKTPYWRESWTEAFILCNACGLRFSKFRRRCVKCNYVPRKEDKGARECTQCSGAWSQ